MDLIEVLWKQDVDLGFTLVDSDPAKQSSSKADKESADEVEKLRALEKINATKNEVNIKLNKLISIIIIYNINKLFKNSMK